MTTTMDRATQAYRYDVAAGLLQTDRAGAIAQIRAMPAGARKELQGLVDWVAAYAEAEVSA